MHSESLTDLSAWAMLLIQGGALAILGYHLLVGLPRLIERIIDSQQVHAVHSTTQISGQLEGFERRCMAICASIEKLAEALPQTCAYARFRLEEGHEPPPPRRPRPPS